MVIWEVSVDSLEVREVRVSSWRATSSSNSSMEIMRLLF